MWTRRRRSDEGENGEVRWEKSGEKREGRIAPEKYKCSKKEEAGRWERKTESGFARYNFVKAMLCTLWTRDIPVDAENLV